MATAATEPTQEVAAAQPPAAAPNLPAAAPTPPASRPSQPGPTNAISGAAEHQQNGRPNGHPIPGPVEKPAGDAIAGAGQACTAPQLRRFIKSRAYVPMHELRRRFGINGGEDDVTRVELDGGQIYVGLPGHEGRLLGELLRGGEVGYELSLDPRSPVVIGVYPMRPVPRQ